MPNNKFCISKKAVKISFYILLFFFLLSTVFFINNRYLSYKSSAAIKTSYKGKQNTNSLATMETFYLAYLGRHYLVLPYPSYSTSITKNRAFAEFFNTNDQAFTSVVESSFQNLKIDSKNLDSEELSEACDKLAYKTFVNANPTLNFSEVRWSKKLLFFLGQGKVPEIEKLSPFNDRKPLLKCKDQLDSGEFLPTIANGYYVLAIDIGKINYIKDITGVINQSYVNGNVGITYGKPDCSEGFSTDPSPEDYVDGYYLNPLKEKLAAYKVPRYLKIDLQGISSTYSKKYIIGKQKSVGSCLITCALPNINYWSIIIKKDVNNLPEWSSIKSVWFNFEDIKLKDTNTSAIDYNFLGGCNHFPEP